MFGGASIGRRLMLFIISVVLLPTAFVLAFFYGQFNGIIRNSLLDSQTAASLQAAEFIDNTAKTLLSVCDTVADDERLPALLAAGRRDDVDTLRAVIDSHVRSNSLSAIRIFSDIFVTNISAANEPVTNVSAAPEPPAVISNISEIKNTYWYGIFASRDIDALFAPEFYLSAAERAAYGNLAVIRKRVFEVGGSRVTVFVVVYTHNDILVNSIRDIGLKSVEGIISFILNSREAVVAETDKTAYGTYAISYGDIAKAIPSEGVFIRKDVAGTGVFMTYRDIGAADWRVAWIVPQASIAAQSRRVIFQFALIYASMALLTLIIGIFISNTIVRRVKFLRNQMRQMKTERPKPLAMAPGKDEVGELIETYNYMVGCINALLDDTIQAANELRNVEIKALRTQIDPHFLYNTLDMINWLIKAESNGQALEAIMALSRFYRLTLNRGNLTASVAAELEHVSLYIKLMNMRFDGAIEYIADIPEDMLEYEIPLIILQPVVENAIQHGIFEKPSKSGQITITGWSDDDTLYLMVSDDGIGMTAGQISRLTSAGAENAADGGDSDGGDSGNGSDGGDSGGNSNDSAGGAGGSSGGDNNDSAGGAGGSSGNGIGVYNTHRRLQLMSGRDDCGLSYSSEYGKGTDVILRISKYIAPGRQGKDVADE